MNRSAWSGFVLVLLVSGAWGQESGLSKASCAGLAKLTLPNTKIMLAEQVEAGGVSPTRTVARNGADTNLPAASGILQSGGGSGTLGRLRYQGGSVDAGQRLER